MINKFHFSTVILICVFCFIDKGECQDLDSITEQVQSDAQTNTKINLAPGTIFSEQDYRGISEKNVRKYKKKEDQNISTPFIWDIISSIVIFIKRFYYIFIIIIALIVAYYATGMGKYLRQQQKTNKNLDYNSDEEEEIDLKLSNFDALISKYENLREFRVAVRYLYLLLLQKLDEKSIITAAETKKNIDYYYEIKDSEMQKNFDTALHLYEYIWYGKNSLQEQDYKSVSSFYKRFYLQIR
ncbi:MAG: hypothetical protein ACK5L5_05150 [Bacteroidales bacterium]